MKKEKGLISPDKQVYRKFLLRISDQKAGPRRRDMKAMKNQNKQEQGERQRQRLG